METFLSESKWRSDSISKNSYLILKYWDYRSIKMYRRAKSIGFRVATRENLLKYKKSYRLYIFGSGPSINDIDNKQWDTIAQHDSFGFNSFYVHPFTPTYYHVELLSQNADLFKECYLKKIEYYKDIPLILNMIHLYSIWAEKWAEKKELDYINNMYVSIPKTYSGADSTQFKEILRYEYFKRGYCKDNLLVHHRASLSLAISFGVLMGYKEIVLAGVDMFNMDYFFYNEKLYSGSVARKEREAKLDAVSRYRDNVKTDSNLHKTADPNSFKGLTLDEAVVIMNEEVLKPKGVKLYLLSKQSLLYPRIEVL